MKDLDGYPTVKQRQAIARLCKWKRIREPYVWEAENQIMAQVKTLLQRVKDYQEAKYAK